MYETHLKKRKIRTFKPSGRSESSTVNPTAKGIFEPSFLDDFKIDYTPKEYREIVWESTTKPSRGWERLFAS